MEDVVEKWLAAAGDQPKPWHGDSNRAAHNKGKAGIPGAEEVKKILDFGWIGHARQQKAEAKQKTGKKCDEVFHGISPQKRDGAAERRQSQCS